MGMSCTFEQGEALDRIRKLHGKDGLIAGRYFIDVPANRDYGINGRETMCLAVYEVLSLKMRTARKIGYARIKPDGKIYLPREVRRIIKQTEVALKG